MTNKKLNMTKYNDYYSFNLIKVMLAFLMFFLSVFNLSLSIVLYVNFTYSGYYVIFFIFLLFFVMVKWFVDMCSEPDFQSFGSKKAKFAFIAAILIFFVIEISFFLVFFYFFLLAFPNYVVSNSFFLLDSLTCVLVFSLFCYLDSVER
jgi:hypothetical protein